MIRTILGHLIFFMVKVLSLTYRFHPQKEYNPKENSPHNKFIYAFWHNNLLMALLQGHRIGMSLAAMVSASKDGELVALTAKKLGFSTIRGSSGKKGVIAYKKMISFLKKGNNGAIAIDGPRGPIYKVKQGIIDLSLKTSHPIIPIYFFCNKKWIIKKSWDRFQIPRPFSTIHSIWGTPIIIPEHTSREEFKHYQIKLDKELKRLEKKIKDKIL